MFARHVLRAEAPDDVVERYVEAHRRLLSEPPTPRDEAVEQYLRRNPRALGPLDAASGLLRPRGRLRHKLLLATAIFEATTTFAPVFLGRQVSMPRLAASFVWLGLVAGLRAAVGVPLLLLVERRGA